MTKRSIFLVAVALAIFLPTLIQFSNFATYNKKKTDAVVFRLPVVGFDPRDLARGRYATLQIDWRPQDVTASCNNDEVNMPDYERCGFCLARINDKTTKIVLVPPQTPGCDAFVAAENVGNLTTRKFFIDERYANRVDQALRERAHDFSANIVFTDKDMMINELYIDGVPYKQFIENK